MPHERSLPLSPISSLPEISSPKQKRHFQFNEHASTGMKKVLRNPQINQREIHKFEADNESEIIRPRRIERNDVDIQNLTQSKLKIIEYNIDLLKRSIRDLQREARLDQQENIDQINRVTRKSTDLNARNENLKVNLQKLVKYLNRELTLLYEKMREIERKTPLHSPVTFPESFQTRNFENTPIRSPNFDKDGFEKKLIAVVYDKFKKHEQEVFKMLTESINRHAVGSSNEAELEELKIKINDLVLNLHKIDSASRDLNKLMRNFEVSTKSKLSEQKESCYDELKKLKEKLTTSFTKAVDQAKQVCKAETRELRHLFDQRLDCDDSSKKDMKEALIEINEKNKATKLRFDEMGRVQKENKHNFQQIMKRFKDYGSEKDVLMERLNQLESINVNEATGHINHRLSSLENRFQDALSTSKNIENQLSTFQQTCKGEIEQNTTRLQVHLDEEHGEHNINQRDDEVKQCLTNLLDSRMKKCQESFAKELETLKNMFHTSTVDRSEHENPPNLIKSDESNKEERDLQLRYVSESQLQKLVASIINNNTAHLDKRLKAIKFEINQQKKEEQVIIKTNLEKLKGFIMKLQKDLELEQTQRKIIENELNQLKAKVDDK